MDRYQLSRRLGPARSVALRVVLAALGFALAACSAPPRRIDPIFGLETPLLFAHRGGAREAPESTELAFNYARGLPVDVLELDVQLTLDGQFVVWHGPQLDNVRIKGQNNEAPCQRQRRKINEYSWDELEKNAWVADPCRCCADCCSDLQHVPKDEERELLLFSTFLQKFPCAPTNVELKESVRVGDVHRFIKILDDQIEEEKKAHTCGKGERKVLIVSQSAALVDEVRAQSGERYATGEPAIWALGKVTRCVPLPMGLKQFVLPVGNMRNRALQTSWSPLLSCQPLLSQVRLAGGASHVFLTGLLFPGLDACPGEVSQSEIDTILNRGADGIMTDRPGEVKELLKKWKEKPLDAEAVGESHGNLPSCSPAAPRPDALGEFEKGLDDRLHSHVRTLAKDIGPRSWKDYGSWDAYDGLLRAKEYVRADLSTAGYAVDVLPYTPLLPEGRGREFFNLEATLKGTSHPEEIVVVGAHYDTDATDKCGPTPGADDNASGVAALIELARYFSRRPLSRTLRFVAFTNEEEPFFCGRKEDMGSWQYAEMAHQRGDNIVAMLSLETMGYYVPDRGSQHGVWLGRLFGLNLPDRGDFVSFVANSGSADEVECALSGFKAYSNFPVEKVVLPGWLPWTQIDWSDHRSFWQHGYKGMMVTDTAPERNKAYHKRWDTADSLNYDAMSQVVKGLVGAIEALAGTQPIAGASS